MDLSDIDYELPEASIAQFPVEPRDSARLLVDQGGLSPKDHRVSDLADFLREGDFVVMNNTRVMAARLPLMRSTGGAVEVLMLEPLDPEEHSWTALVRPGGKLREGEPLFDADGMPALIFQGRSSDDPDTFVVTFKANGEARALMNRIGSMPLPPYIREVLQDPSRYQTVFAASDKSAAAPTAGLHLTTSLLDRIKAKGVAIGEVELAVGLGTFKPVTAQNPLEHQIHSEWYYVPSEVMQQCRDAKRVIAIGTTSVRALESAATTGELTGRTQLFIHRGYDWKVVDLMLTNFHMPHTSLLLMIHAFVGDRWRRLYSEALERGYRFLSFGDAMLLDRHLSE